MAVLVLGGISSAVKYLHQEYAKTQSQIGPLEKYLHQEYVKTRYQIVSLSKKSAPGKISASGICENSKSYRFNGEVSTPGKNICTRNMPKT